MRRRSRCASRSELPRRSNSSSNSVSSAAWRAATAAAAASTCHEERPTLLEAFSYLDRDQAARMAEVLRIEIKLSRKIDDRDFNEQSPAWRQAQEQLMALDEAGEDYEVWSYAEVPVDQVHAEEAKAWDEPPTGSFDAAP